MQVRSERFELRLDQVTIQRIDAWRSDQSDLPSRAEAMRRLVDAGLGRPEDRQLFLMARFDLLYAARSNGLAGAISDAYAFAWHAEVYPFFDHASRLHQPFAMQFSVSPKMIEELAKFLDDRWRKKDVPSFYAVEDHYRILIGHGPWNRAKLIYAFRYLFLSNLFDSEFWKNLLKDIDYPTEAEVILAKFDRDHDIAF